jgi:light-regulated signal transduction histidine kinase (bacteriophytochrome)
LSEDNNGLVNHILSANHRMNTLIDDLFMYAHVSRGAVREEKVDINEKVMLVLKNLEVKVAENKASCERVDIV